MKPYRINLKLDAERDADLIAWIESQPRGTRSEAIRETLRVGLGMGSEKVGTQLDLGAVRSIVADEITKALTNVAPGSVSGTDQSQDDLEDEYGDKLDQMLGNFG